MASPLVNAQMRLPNRARAIEVIKLPDSAIAGAPRRGFTPSVIEGDLGRDHRVIAIDLPGCGQTDKPEPGATREGYLSEIA